ncbi:hypothetical protein V8C42DRAFT_83886 [Trichoderma barbatum]
MKKGVKRNNMSLIYLLILVSSPHITSHITVLHLNTFLQFLLFNIIHHRLIHPLVYKSTYTEVFSHPSCRSKYKTMIIKDHPAPPSTLIALSAKGSLPSAMMPKISICKQSRSRWTNPRTITLPCSFPLLVFLQLLCG